MTNRPIADEAVRKQVIEDTVNNMLLEAGAGAGKSTIMVERILFQIFSKSQPIENIVAITFTEKAATELEEKFTTELDKRLKAFTEDEKLKAHIMANRSAMFIGTIHSFCQRIIKERPIESGIPLDFQLVTEQEESVKREQFFVRALQDVALNMREWVAYFREQQLPVEAFRAMFDKMVDHLQLGIPMKARTPIHTLEEVKAAVEQGYQLLDASITMEYPTKKIIDFLSKKVRDGCLVAGAVDYLRLYEACQKETNFNQIAAHYEPVMDVLKAKLAAYDLDIYAPYKALLEEPIVYDGKPYTLITVLNGITATNIADKISGILLKLKQDRSTVAVAKSHVAKVDTPEFQQQLDRLLAVPFPQELFDILNTDIVAEPSNELMLSLLDITLEKQSLALLFDARQKKPKKGLDKFSNSEEIKAELQAWQERVLPFDVADTINIVIQSVLHDIAKRYVIQCMKYGELNFNDLLARAYAILCNPDARAFFYDKYRHLYVDEVQDTDPLQMKILFLLTAEQYEQHMSWLDVKTAPNRLFLVGDPKQSIYRFRNADLRIYGQLQQRAKQPGWKSPEISVNFRSRPLLIDWFNKRYSELFDEEQSVFIQPRYKDMLPFDAEENIDAFLSPSEYGIKFYKVTNSKEKNTKSAAENEAACIADWIGKNVGKLHVYNAKEQTVDKLTYEDVLIILPATTKMVDYLQVLRRAGIPTSFSGKVSVKHFKEVHRLFALVKFIAQRTMESGMQALLLCEQYSLTELYTLKEKLEMLPIEERLTCEAFASLQAYAQKAAIINDPIAFLQYVIYEKPDVLFNNVLEQTEYDAGLSLLTTFIEKIRENAFSSYAQLSQFFDGILLDDFQLEYEMATDAKGKAVRLMNLHKAKGLEAPVVFLADNRKVKNFETTYYIERLEDGTEYAHYNLFKTEKWSFGATVLFNTEALNEQFKDEMRDHDFAEMVRLLYVAATRGRQLVFISAGDEAKEKNELTEEEQAPLNWTKLLKDEAVIAFDVATVENKEPIWHTLQINAPALSYTAQTYGDAAASKLGSKTLTEDELSSLDVLLAAETRSMKRNPYASALWGNMVHELYEMYMSKRLMSVEACTEDLLDLAMTKGLAQYELSASQLENFNIEAEAPNRNARLQALKSIPEVRAGLREELAKLIHNEGVQALIDGAALYPELQYKVKMTPADEVLYAAFSKSDDREKNLTLYATGFIDLLIHKGDHCVILDYKTNECGEDAATFVTELIETYQRQLHAYRVICEQQFGLPVKGLYLYATSIDQLIELPLVK